MFKTKSLTVALILVLVVTMLAGCGTAPKAAEEIKIGTIGPLTGDYATYGENIRKGVEIAIEEINKAGGVGGKQVKLIAEDTKGVPDDAAKAATKLMDQDSVTAIVGAVLSGETKTAAPFANDAKVTMISPSSTATGIPDIGPYIFRNCLSDDIQGAQLAEYAVTTLGSKKFAILYAKNDYGEALKNAVEGKAKELASVVAVESYNDGEQDFNAVLTSIKAKQPDTLYIAGYYTEAAKIAQQAKDQGLSVQILGADGLFSSKLTELGGASVEGAIFTASFYPSDPAEAVQNFVSTYKAKYNEDPDMFSAQGYDAMKMVIEALKVGGTDREAVRNALAAVKDFPGITGKTSFKDNGDCDKEVLILKVENGAFVKIR